MVIRRSPTSQILHLPRKDALKNTLNGDKPIYSDLLQGIIASNNVIDPANELVSQVDESSFDQLFMPGGHPSEKANRVIGEVIARFLMERQNR